jgi:predicted nucleic acid-binding protein
VIKLDEALQGITLLGLDSAPLIYFVERHPVYLLLMREIIRRIDSGLVSGNSSVITLTEVLVQPKKLGRTDIENEYHDLLYHSQNFDLLHITPAIAEQAADLRSRYPIRTPDALQIAAALSVGCQAFLTNDKRLKSVSELKILVLDDLVE